nr:hypothetical protein [uncultured Kingella sp.]
MDELEEKGVWEFQAAFGVGKLLVEQSVVKTKRQPENAVSHFQAAFLLCTAIGSLFTRVRPRNKHAARFPQLARQPET